MKFIVACKKFFETSNSQTLQSFIKEINSLSDKEKGELKSDLEKELNTTIDDI